MSHAANVAGWVRDYNAGYTAYCKGRALWLPCLSEGWRTGWLAAEASHQAASYATAVEQWDDECPY